LDDFTIVSITKQRRRPREDRRRYVVALHGGMAELAIERYATYRLACELAEKIAAATGLPVRDCPSEQYPVRPVTAKTSWFGEETSMPCHERVDSLSSSILEYRCRGGVALVVVGLLLLAISLPLGWSILREVYDACSGPWTAWAAIVAVFKMAVMSVFLCI